VGEVLEHVPETGTTRYFHYDDTDDSFTIETVQDVGELVEDNKAQFNEYTSLDRMGEGRRVASIPMNVYWDLKQRGIVDDPAAFKRWLNDPDNRFFRTSPGTL
jgi:hypothetical protein